MLCTTSRAAALSLVVTLSLSIAEAGPQRSVKRNTARRAPSISWQTTHGPRLTRGPRFQGYGHVATTHWSPALRTVAIEFPPAAKSTAPKPAIATVKHQQPAIASAKHQRFGRILVDPRAVVTARRVVVPAATTAVLVREPRKTIAVAMPALPDVKSEQPWKVQSVMDAARLVVRRDGQIQQVRLLGAALPALEIEAGVKYLEALSVGQEVYLAYDDTIAAQDAEGITTAYLYRAGDERLLNLAIIQAGYALAEGGYDHAHAELFAAAQAEARASDRGMWANASAQEE